MENEKGIEASIRKGFILWSWIGLLGAYMTTSTLFASTIFLIAREGIRIIEFTYVSRTLIMAGILIPVCIIIMAWLTFFRYISNIQNISVGGFSY